MSQPLELLSQMYRFNSGVLDKFTDGFSDSDWLHRPGQANHAYWILGHITFYRREVLRELGDQIAKESWEELFKIRTHPTNQIECISAGLLIQDFHGVGETLCARLMELTPEQAAATREDGTTIPFQKTVQGYVQFFIWHETYHIGQIGLIRRILEKPRLA